MLLFFIFILKIIRKVYQLCARHMNDDMEAVDAAADPNKFSLDTQSFIKQLEDTLNDHHESTSSTKNVEVLCEGVFGVKVLLALESKYDGLKEQQAVNSAGIASHGGTGRINSSRSSSLRAGAAPL